MQMVFCSDLIYLMLEQIWNILLLYIIQNTATLKAFFQSA